MKPKAPGANCEGCPLAQYDAVYGTGPERARISLVGEAPGVQEVKYGEPFVGASGQLLNNELELAGVSRGECYVTNVVLCRPPRNKLAPYAEAVEHCYPRLFKELRKVGSDLVVAMGNYAAGSLLHIDDPKITKERGRRVYDDDLEATIALTFHPAAAMRNSGWLMDMRRDFEVFFGEEDQEPVPPTRYAVLQEEQQVFDVVNRLLNKSPKRVACDLETSAYQPYNGYILCMQLTWRPGEAVIIPEDLLREGGVRGALSTLLSFPSIEFVGHNFGFDAWWLEHHGIQAPWTWLDTYFMDYTLDETRGSHGLKDVGVRELVGVEDWEGELKSHLAKKSDSFATIPKPVLYKYAARDTDINLRIVEPIESKMGEDQRRLYNKILQPAQRPLMEMEARGMRVDDEALTNLEQELGALEHRMEKALIHEAWPVVKNIRSPQQVARMLFDELELPVLVRTPKGGRSTNTEHVLEPLLKRFPDVLFLKGLVRYRQLQKVTGTYLANLRSDMDANGVVHPDFNLAGTVTGRLTAGLYLTLPRVTKNQYAGKIRSLIVPRPGCVIFYADYSQAELRVLACYAQEEFWRDVWLQGHDFHSAMAETIFGEGFDDEERMIAKMVTFGLTYGRREHSVAKQFGWPVAKARRVIEGYLGKVPKVREFMEEEQRKARKEGYLVNHFGRWRRFPVWTRKNINSQLNEALNFKPQSTSNDLTLLSLIELHNNPDFRRGAFFLLPMHDGIVGEVLIEAQDDILPLVKETMQRVPHQHFSDFVPFDVDIKVGASWGEAEEKAKH